jgi:hypothetical protein
MYKSKMFLLEESQDNPTILEETSYEAEDILQKFLEDHPDLLPGDQIDPENPRRWLLVSREMSVPASSTESGRWSLDHLFLDQDGIPTFVECKRSSDTRTRREVVAQMLEYAANGLEYWNMEMLRRAAAETADSKEKSLEEEIATLTDREGEGTEWFWELVKDNLEKHRVRLIFVADSTPKELRRLVEFLNEEMDRVEVLAVEVKQYQKGDGTGQRLLAPRVVGLTESARIRKDATRTAKRPTTREEFINKCTPPEGKEFYQRILDLAGKRNHIIYWGTVGFSIRANLPEKPASFVYGYPNGLFQFYFDEWLRNNQEGRELRKKLLGLGVFKESGKYTLSATVTGDHISKLNEVYDVILKEIDRLQERRTNAE